MKLFLPVLDIAIDHPSIAPGGMIVEQDPNYTPIILIGCAVVLVIALTVFFIKKNKTKRGDEEWVMLY